MTPSIPAPAPTPAMLQARVIVDEWVRGGVREVVVCPGSRNAPLLLAVHGADAAGALRCHVRVDERSAGFLAVGLAARSGRPVPVVVTSGTAVANLHPAVLEASHAGVGLVVVSADRPLELVGTGANQTVDQARLFGGAVRAAITLPPAEPRAGAVAGWRAAVCRVLDRARGTTTADPGPVQLDVPLREPLVGPHDDVREALPAWAQGRPGGAPWTEVACHVPRVEPLDLTAPVATLVVAGHGAEAPDGLPDDVPVLAEPTSPLWGRSLRAGPRLLEAALDGTAPDLLPARVVVVGRPTLHRPVSRLLADPRVQVLVVPAAGPEGARPGWTDVAASAVRVGALPPPGRWGGDPAWAARVVAADARVAAVVRPEAGTGPALAAAVVAALPTGALFVVGSSNPVRDVALAAVPRADVDVRSARGVAGIDGVVSFATGAALAHPGPAYALLGDLTFLHDSGGLFVGPDEPRPELVVVVANDDGGSVFATLEQGAPEHAAAFERMFATPHGTDLAALCLAHGVRHVAPAAGDDVALAAALAPTGRVGVRVVEVAVDRSARRADADLARDAARAALAERDIPGVPEDRDHREGTNPIGSIVGDGG